MEDLYKKIKDVMEDMNINKKELSKRTGINYNTIRGYIDSATNIPLNSLIKIAKALNTSVGYLLGEIPIRELGKEEIYILNYINQLKH